MDNSEEAEQYQPNDKVLIPHGLTNGPLNKQGEIGTIIDISEFYVSVEFEDGIIGKYSFETVIKL